jgi:replicative DNA helicase
LERLDDLNTGKVEPGISTGFTMLDTLMGGGFKSGKQIIVAARPSVGKSSFAEQLCINIAQSGHGVAFLSQEMSGQELTERAVANIGRIRLDNIQTGKLEDHEWGRLTDAMEAIKNLPMYFDDQPSLTLFDIQSKARALKRSHNIKVLVIDYIQLCSGVKDSSRHHQIEELSRGLKGLAKQLEITIITLSQLNREVEKRTIGKPVLSDLKE